MRRRSRPLLALWPLWLGLPLVLGQGGGDLKFQSETQVNFGGALGTVVKFFGGSKPQTQITYLRGNVLRTDMGETSQIIDLDKELFVDVNHKKKEYSVLTFEEWRRQMQEMMAQAEKEARGEWTEEKPNRAKASFDISVKETGQTQMIDGRPEKVEEFHRKLAQKLGQGWMGSGAAMWAAISQSNPELAASMKKLGEESRKLEGTPLVTMTKMEGVGQPRQDPQAAEPEEEEAPTKPSVGGVLGKLAKKKAEPKSGETRSLLFESTTKMSGFSGGELSADLFAVPAGYKEVKRKA